MDKTVVEELYEKIEQLKERNEDLQAEIIKRNQMLTERFGVPPAEVELLFKVEESSSREKLQGVIMILNALISELRTKLELKN